MKTIVILAAILAVFFMSSTFADTMNIKGFPANVASGAYGETVKGGSAPVPEPGMLLVIGFGLVGLGTWTKKKTKGSIHVRK